MNNELTITIQSTSVYGFTCDYEDDFIKAAQLAADTLRSVHGLTAFFSVEASMGETIYGNITKILVNGREVCDAYTYEEKYRDPELLAQFLVEEALRMFGREEAYTHYGLEVAGSISQTETMSII